MVVPGACYLEMIVAGCTTFLGTMAGGRSGGLAHVHFIPSAGGCQPQIKRKF